MSTPMDFVHIPDPVRDRIRRMVDREIRMGEGHCSGAYQGPGVQIVAAQTRLTESKVQNICSGRRPTMQVDDLDRLILTLGMQGEVSPMDGGWVNHA